MGGMPGGRAYGYRAIVGKPGESEIVETQAEIVRDIFGEYVVRQDSSRYRRRCSTSAVWRRHGVDCGTHRLINGNASRGGGISLNNLYAGQIVWTGSHGERPRPQAKGCRVRFEKINTELSKRRTVDC